VALLTAVPVSIPIKIPVSIPVPVMVMLPPAAISVPVTGKVLFSIMMRSYPASTDIRRTRPIAWVPFVMVPHRIPIPLDPDEFGARTDGLGNHARRRRSSDSDSNRHLSGERRYATQDERRKQDCPHEASHVRSASVASSDQDFSCGDAFCSAAIKPLAVEGARTSEPSMISAPLMERPYRFRLASLSGRSVEPSSDTPAKAPRARE
jgi:hypothetical protein